MSIKSSLNLIGYAYGEAAGDVGCVDGPDAFKNSKYFKRLAKEHPEVVWDSTFYKDPHFPEKFLSTQNICLSLAHKTETLTKEKKRFVVLGGDHSSAIGTWSGVSTALGDESPIGLLWVDAHMDSHTPETSSSGNIHGMPLAALLGYGDPLLTNLLKPTPKLLPQNICLIGIRSFEAGEAELLRRLNVRIFDMEEVEKRGLPAIFSEALSIVQNNTVGFGITIDLDAFDPNEVPGVGSPEEKGLPVQPFCELLSTIAKQPDFLGAEITEFNPHHDQNHKTESVIYDLINAML